MVKDLIGIVEGIQLKGGVISTKDNRYNSKMQKYSSVNYECNDNCDCFRGDCSDCICTDCQDCDDDN